MLPFQQRVIDEKEELDTKITNLNTFLTKGGFEIRTDELNRLIKQLAVMREYSNILKERIENFT